MIRDKRLVNSTKEVVPSFAQVIVDPIRISRVAREIHSKKIKIGSAVFNVISIVFDALGDRIHQN